MIFTDRYLLIQMIRGVSPKFPVDNEAILVPVVVWHRTGAKVNAIFIGNYAIFLYRVMYFKNFFSKKRTETDSE